ncbi:MAG: hypothetical protein AVDCRST_MAG37-2494, partial [uncultured Rubrobacteraceae bacterium]
AREAEPHVAARETYNTRRPEGAVTTKASRSSVCDVDL